MRVLILGSYGMLGHKMLQVLGADFDVYSTCRSFREEWVLILPKDRVLSGVQAEIFDSVIKAFAITQPDIVINCIGIVKQLDAAKDPIPSIKINSLFPHELALLCQSRGARLIHFSTDCVFSGKKGNYREDDIHDTEDLYSRTKYLGEVSGKGCLTIRSSIIGRELGTKHGLVEWFLSQSGKKVKGYSKAIYTGFTTNAMARIVRELIENHPSLSGIWHVASNPISKYDLLRKINEKMKLNIEIEKDAQFECDRSLNGERFARETGIVAPSWKMMIEDLVDEARLY
jgi:dTDP-4-dehydrorhamnose reductase